MNQIIREVSTRLIQLLPEEQQFFTADDLKALGMPDFIIDRILCDLTESLLKSINLSKSDWIDDQQPKVQQAWMHFISQIQAFTRMPRQQAAEIIDNAVIDVVDMLSRPRQRSLEVLFGMDSRISMETLRFRSERITVNQYLTIALIRYMDRKKWSEITKSDAERVLKMVDNRYVEGFSPLLWAQSLDALFQLSGNKVDKELIVDFFIDKERDDLAALFESLSGTINRSTLIERIALGPIKESVFSKPKEETQEASPLEIVSESESETENIVESFTESEYEMDSDSETIDESESTLDLDLDSDFDSEPESKSKIEIEEEVEVDLEQDLPSRFYEQLITEQESPDEISSGALHEVLEKSVTPTVPIWQQFLDDVDEDDIEPEESEILPSVTRSEEAQMPPGPSVSLGQQKIALVEWLKPDESDYIDSIFLGNQLMYFRSLGSLEALKDWSEAQVFIKESIIELMDLDYKDPVLIQFIDQIQSYFSPTDF